MSKKDEFIQIGSSGFHIETIRKLSWKKFEEKYSKIATGLDLKEVYLKCGGKIKE